MDAALMHADKRGSTLILHVQVSMDDPDAAFLKMKKIIKDIVNSQPNLKPMFDIEFSDMDKEHPFIKKKLADISNVIAPMRLFY